MNKYWYELDGLRAIAILIVLLAHGGAPYPRSGTIGVEIFFVLSGFLITYILHQEYLKYDSINLRFFYYRRALRLLPGLLAACTLFSIVSYIMYGNLKLNIVAIALTYTSNWARALFNYDLESLSHTWSLSLEEQYYFIWPFVVLLLERKFRRNIVKALFLLSMTLCIAFYRNSMVEVYSSARIYFGLDTHSDGLVLGSALLYATFDRSEFIKLNSDHSRVLRCIAIPMSIITLAILMNWMDWNTPWMGKFGFLIISLASAIIIFDLVLDGFSILKVILSHCVLVYVGQRSYSLYLVHFPIFVFVDYVLSGYGPSFIFVAKLALSFIFAIFSYEMIEKKCIRLKKKLSRFKQ